MSALPTLSRADAAPTADSTRVLYERYSNRIFAYCMSRLGSREEAEDAMQTTFLNAFRSLQSGVVPQFELAWLFRIAENVCRDGHKSASRRRRVETTKDLQEVQDIVSAPSRNADGLVGLADALAEMPERQRHAILLREWQGLSYAEIANELGLSRAAVETLIFRARRSLARGLTAPQMRRRAWSFDLLSLLGFAKAAFKGGAAAKVAASAIAVGGAALVVTVPLADRPRSAPDSRVHATAPGASPVDSKPASRPAASFATTAGGASRPAPDSSRAAKTGRTASQPSRAPGRSRAVPPSAPGSAGDSAAPAEVPGGTAEVPTPAADPPRSEAPAALPPPAPTPPTSIPDLPGLPELPPVAPPAPLAPPPLPPVPPVPPVEPPGLPPVPPVP